MEINKLNGFLNGEIRVPGDKSISHRSVILGSISEGKTQVKNFLMGEDCLDTIKCFRKLGVKIEIKEREVLIHGVGINGLKKPDGPLYAGNSGTTIRLLTGLLSGQSFETTILGDDSLSKRPMERITKPLSLMGADLNCNENKYPPIVIKPVDKLNGIKYKQSKASAQVKSSIMLAGLYTDDDILINQPEISRDHTERMMKYFGVDIKVDGKKIYMNGKKEKLKSRNIFVPGDISSAAFYIIAALIIKDSHIVIKDVGINPTRTGIIDVMLEMGANIRVSNKRVVNEEELGDIEVKYSKLKSVEIGGDIIPRIIDEIPIIALAANFAKGKTIIKDAEELKVKESNRIDTVCYELNKMGMDITPTEDGMIINGGKKLKGAKVDSKGDHRIAMMLAVAGFISEGKTYISNFNSVNVSNPNFIKIFNSICHI